MVYLIIYVLDQPFAFFLYFIAALVVGELVALPSAILLMNKIGHYKIFKYFSLALILLPALLFIADNLYWFMALYFVAGFIVSHVVSATPLNSSDMIDADVDRTGRRREGAYGGFIMLINRVGPLVGSIIIGVTHPLTGYDEGADIQSAEAIMGIKLHFGVIPVVIGVICFVLYQLLWKIRPEQMPEIREKIKQLGI